MTQKWEREEPKRDPKMAQNRKLKEPEVNRNNAQAKARGAQGDPQKNLRMKTREAQMALRWLNNESSTPPKRKPKMTQKWKCEET